MKSIHAKKKNRVVHKVVQVFVHAPGSGSMKAVPLKDKCVMKKKIMKTPAYKVVR